MELPPPGRALYALLSVDAVDNPYFDAKKDSQEKAKQLEWTFIKHDNANVKARIWSTASISEYKGTRSKCWQLSEALLSRELTQAEKMRGFETDELIGKKCFLTLKHEKTADGKVRIKVIDFESYQEEK